MFINLTPHRVNIIGLGSLAKCNTPARVVSSEAKSGNIEGVKAYVQRNRRVVDLPDPREGVYLIVSSIVRHALPNRKDLVSPYGLKRGKGKKCTNINCKGLITNW